MGADVKTAPCAAGAGAKKNKSAKAKNAGQIRALAPSYGRKSEGVSPAGRRICAENKTGRRDCQPRRPENMLYNLINRPRSFEHGRAAFTAELIALYQFRPAFGAEILRFLLLRL